MDEPDGPRIRAISDLEMVRELEAHRPGMGKELAEHVPPEVFERLSRAGRRDWVRLEDSLLIRDAAVKILGADETTEFVANGIAKMVNEGPLRGLVTGILRMFGVTPMGCIKGLERAWSTMTRDCGKFDVVPREGGARVRFVALPEFARNSEGLRRMHAGALIGAVRVAGHEAQLEFDESDFWTFTLRWNREQRAA